MTAMTGALDDKRVNQVRTLVLSTLLLLVMTGCSVTPLDQHASEEIENPDTHWQLNSRIGIRHGDTAKTFSLTWQQRDEVSDIRLTGTLGVSVANISITPNLASIDIPSQGSFQSANASQLLYEHTGVTMPLDLLTFWVRGKPAPTLPWKTTSQGFQQSGWDIQIDKVVDALPMKLVFLKGETSIKMAVRSWQ